MDHLSSRSVLALHSRPLWSTQCLSHCWIHLCYACFMMLPSIAFNSDESLKHPQTLIPFTGLSSSDPFDIGKQVSVLFGFIFQVLAHSWFCLWLSFSRWRSNFAAVWLCLNLQLKDIDVCPMIGLMLQTLLIICHLTTFVT